jgi:hypothetical protein
MLLWLKKRGFPLSKDTSSAAVSRLQSIPVLQYLNEAGCEWRYDCCGKAGAAGDVVQLQWLCNHGAPVNISSAYDAAISGSVQVFEILQQQEVAFDHVTMQKAAQHGHLQLCKWLRAAGCNWSSYVVCSAAFSDSVETVRWLLDNGCECDPDDLCLQLTKEVALTVCCAIC